MMVDPRQALGLVQGGMGGGPMGGPQIPQQIMPQQAPQAMQAPQPGGGMQQPGGGMQQAMQDPRIMAYLRALQGGMR